MNRFDLRLLTLNEHSIRAPEEELDVAEQAAWNWLIRQFDSPEGLNEAAEDEFSRWLAKDPQNLDAYDRALAIWTAARCLDENTKTT